MGNSTQVISELLVRYLDGELNPEESAKLQQYIGNDPGLQRELEDLKLSRDLLQYAALKENVSRVHQEMMKKESNEGTKIGNMRKVIRLSMSIAAGIILIVTGLFVFNVFSPSAGKIFKEYYQPYEMTIVRGQSGASEIEQAYQDKKFNDVVMKARVRPTPSELLLAGLSWIELNNEERAVFYLKAILEKPLEATPETIRDGAEYYLALTYIRGKKYEQAYEILQRIQNDPSHVYHEKADEKLMKWIEKKIK